MEAVLVGGEGALHVSNKRVIKISASRQLIMIM